MIDRKELVRRHNPVLHGINAESPMTVGNGEFAFSADITGFQTLYNEYQVSPLCVMSRWGWHTEPAAGGRTYTLSDAETTAYERGGRRFEYAVECRRGNEAIYNWLRRNPHRLNLARVSLLWDGCVIRSGDITNIRQELDLYHGVLHSDFELFGYSVSVLTVCAKNADAVGFSVTSAALNAGLLSAGISFPYGSHRISASDWHSTERHTTEIAECGGDSVLLERTLDSDRYYVRLNGCKKFDRIGSHDFTLSGEGGALAFAMCFTSDKPTRFWDYSEVYEDSRNGWEHFWQNGGAVDFSGAKDKRARELERRTVLSQYLTAVHCAGVYPPQETGLGCNSWYGKFHLEMHILHAGWFPLWNRSALLEKSFDWYLDILDNARENAARNGFKGARWPKMTGPSGIDSPSRIATLLIWQQPHILYMLELVLQSKTDTERHGFMRKYWSLVSETAEFMCDFANFNADTGRYDLAPPLIPAQEEHAPETALNPAFELSYWHFGLSLAVRWAEELGEPCAAWAEVLEKLADSPVLDGLYPAHQNCPDTFAAYNRDHPSMLFGYGFIPCERIDTKKMSATADKVLSCWDWQTAWGWDFALTAMTLTRLGRPEAAIDALLADTPKNSYVTSGSNYQRGRNDLPLYLPGNGSLLLALAMMLAGYGNVRSTPGLPKNGLWEDVRFEGISPLPY